MLIIASLLPFALAAACAPQAQATPAAQPSALPTAAGNTVAPPVQPTINNLTTATIPVDKPAATVAATAAAAVTAAPLGTVEPRNLGLRTEGWVATSYACSAMEELQTIQHSSVSFDVLKCEYLAVAPGGTVVEQTETDAGCNGASDANIDFIKQSTREQGVTVSGNNDVIRPLLLSKKLQQAFILKVGQYVKGINFGIVDVDLEGSWDWSAEEYQGFMQLLEDGTQAWGDLGLKTQVCVPANADADSEDGNKFKYADIAKIEGLGMTVMDYDRQFDVLKGPISPLDWFQNVINFALSKIDSSRLIIGVPAYGCSVVPGTDRIENLTFDEIKTMPGFETAQRDPDSLEMHWQNEEKDYWYVDPTALRGLGQIVAASGVPSTSLWCVGGHNPTSFQ